ncbi:MAG: TRAP transporter small permease [Lachnospiraceae bacterium]|nr:TRAP transporter small permease [Lachnospiraceae bacterium]
MKAFKAVIDFIVKVVSGIEMLLISAIVVLIVLELLLRNILNTSLHVTTELCGFLFMWLAFLGLIVLFEREGLIALDILSARANGKVALIFWYINKVFSLGLGVVMVVAYIGLYPYVSTSYFSSMPWLTKGWHFLPMAVAGGFLALDSLYKILAKLLKVEDKKEVEKA